MSDTLARGNNNDGTSPDGDAFSHELTVVKYSILESVLQN